MLRFDCRTRATASTATAAAAGVEHYQDYQSITRSHLSLIAAVGSGKLVIVDNKHNTAHRLCAEVEVLLTEFVGEHVSSLTILDVNAALAV